MMDHLKKLCALEGVSGCEAPVRRYILNALKGSPAEITTEVDALGNIIARIKGRNPAAKTVLFAAHMDEVGLIITGVTDAPVAAAPAAAAPAPAAPAAVAGTPVKAPMPGTILALKATPGQAVKAGEVLLVLEAMKMENDIVAPVDGTVGQILVAKGATVNTDDVLLSLS